MSAPSLPSLPSLLVSRWELQPVLAAELVLSAGLYLWGATRARRGWPWWRTGCWLAGLASVVLALGSGIERYDDWLLSVHMVQHMLLLMVAPLLFICARPVRLALLTLPPDPRRDLAGLLSATRRFTGPLACLAAFYLIVIGAHVPALYSATLRHPVLHDCEHVLYLIAGGLLWWPLLGDDPHPSRRLGGLGALAYVLASMPPMALVGAYLNRLPTLAYPAYAGPAHTLGISALSDQAQAGAIMWVAGNLLMVLAGLWAVLAAMVREERRLDRREAQLLGTGAPRPDAGR